eukprot:CAMPEP_0197446450 /NCGR_PEP_ID=MMETSP1175-20131217/11397_1 /TAXON_ID=1003142 /ORGANISM="Triceratium dubium, Strain CCMP147" /LENGTH=77 /DNA_ID=CAMNT_0042977567 /DNA_START=18 /DNA_END=251 /DNA_ORIENTATION=-
MQAEMEVALSTDGKKSLWGWNRKMYLPIVLQGEMSAVLEGAMAEGARQISVRILPSFRSLAVRSLEVDGGWDHLKMP